METIAMSPASLFKTPEGADKYHAAYDAVLALWPVPHQALDVQTSFGMTHINTAGSPELPPLILLHGFGVCSTQWYSNIAPLSRYFRVYAPDVLSQMGLSVATRRPKTRQNYAAWLTEVLDALDLERVCIVGHSYGGWLSLNLALSVPQRVERIVLLSPAASFASIRLPFLLHFLSAVFIPTRSRIHGFMQSTTTMPLSNSHPIIEQLIVGIKHFNGQQIGAPVVSVFTEDELRQITVPTLLLIGDHDVSCKLASVLARAQRLIPNIEAELVLGGGHLFPTDQADVSNTRMLEFLQG
jgi:pimeloyl-ACP methyl ester carboxylesterase